MAKKLTSSRPTGFRSAQKSCAGEKSAPELGNALPLKSIPLGTAIHNVELVPGRGGQIARSAGQQVMLNNREAGYALVKMPSGEIRKINENAYATIGPGRQRGSHECEKRQSWTHTLAGPSAACPRHGDESSRSPDGWRPGKIKRRRRTSSSGQPVGPARERFQDASQAQAERARSSSSAANRRKKLNKVWADL